MKKSILSLNAVVPYSATMVRLAVVSLAALAVVGCKSLDDGTRVEGWAVTDPDDMHPIIVTQKPSTVSFKVARGSSGLTPSQRARLSEFVAKYRAADAGNSRLIIKAPAGGANEVASMQAVAEIRYMLRDMGFDETVIAVEAYHEGGATPAIHVSYQRYIAEGPNCGRFPDNLANNSENTNYDNFGCAQSHNLAVMVANPADLVGPRTETPRSSERRYETYTKYLKGDITSAKKSEDERARTKKSD